MLQDAKIEFMDLLILDRFTATQPGEPYRLLPFGVIYKGGKRREVTKQLAATFKLPHFKPAIKIGSHEETTPAGGFIVGLEVRKDGLYAVPEFTDKGLKVLADGSYRYHSPEILWEGGFEDPTTGKLLEGPLIIGDALLHMPHMGEAAALYQVQPTTKQPRQLTPQEATNTLDWLIKRTARERGVSYYAAFKIYQAEKPQVIAGFQALQNRTR
jgi:hypothetical protein